MRLQLVGVVPVIGVAWVCAAEPEATRLPHEAYVWQRTWNDPVRAAVTNHADTFQRIVILSAEVTWQNKQPRILRIPIDYVALHNLDTPVGLALRIGPYSGPFATNSPATVILSDLAASLVAQAETNGVVVDELQIDFDCATSKLDGYRVWLESISRKVSPTPVTITALPSWLESSNFGPLAESASNYVLQVHSLERPQGINDRFELCDSRTATQAVRRAARFGVPFRAALPTYGYLLAFDREGRFVGLSAEGPGRSWPEGVQIREVRADPLSMARLVQGWDTNRPSELRGVIWYRLPTTVDNLNWRWPTLGAIVASRLPRERIRAETRQVETRLVEINLVNDGELDSSSRLAVEVRWSDARLVAGDGLGGFTLADRNGPSTATFQTRSQSLRLPAGERLKAGWLRFDRDCEVQVELKKF
jgi:hypothetical protein